MLLLFRAAKAECPPLLKLGFSDLHKHPLVQKILRRTEGKGANRRKYGDDVCMSGQSIVLQVISLEISEIVNKYLLKK